MRVIVGIIFSFLVPFIFFVGTVSAQYTTGPTIGATVSTYPTLPLCSEGNCGTVCNDGYCPAGSTCSPYCASNGHCGFTCSAYQNRCINPPGWGDWGPCVNCWQVRECNSNPNLGQYNCCISDSSCDITCNVPASTPGNPTGPAEPTVPPPTNTPIPPTNTPVQQGNLQARTVRIDPADTSCAAIRAVPTTDGEIDGSVLQFTPSSASQPPSQTQIGANYAAFNNVTVGTYTLDPNVPTANWAYTRACWRNISTGATGEGLSATLANTQTVRWDIGYTDGTSWVRARGGDVYAAGSVRSFIPDLASRQFITTSPEADDGVLIYGTSFDFDSDPYSTGATLVSGTNWQVNASRTTVDYYDYFYRRYGSPTTATTDAAFSNLSAVTQPTSSDTPYYVVGDMTTTGNWSVGAGESVVIIVDGNVALGGQINITGDGFITFIVNGDIDVTSSIGGTSGSTTPVIEGIYITSPTGTFATGVSAAAATAKFVGKGMFISGNFLLERDLEIANANNLSASEVFFYNPRLLLSMPDSMKELSVTWQEVAP